MPRADIPPPSSIKNKEYITATFCLNPKQPETLAIGMRLKKFVSEQIRYPSRYLLAAYVINYLTFLQEK